MTDEEYAEREALINQINYLNDRIYQAKVERENLREELRFALAALAMLTLRAGELSQSVTSDVSALASYVGREEVEARDLLQELHSLADRYFSYKSLSTATKNATRYTEEYYRRFSFYRNLRRIALGAVMAVDRTLISHETARARVERAYLANTDYWLSYAIMAVMLWWGDERQAAERARSRALVTDERKAALFFLFCNLKFGRVETAARWYAYYLGTIHANDVGPEYQYLLEAYLSGAFGARSELSADVLPRFEAMMSEVTLYNINYHKDVAEAARRALATRAHATDFAFFYLAEYCPDVEELRGTLESAEKCLVRARELEELADEQTDYEGVEDRLEQSIYNLIEAMDADEEKVWRKIKYNELIVAARGNVTLADQAFNERYPEVGPVALGELMQRWALTEDDPRILPEVRRFALRRLVPSIRTGYTAFAEGYRAGEHERYQIALDDWTFACNEGELTLAQQSYNAHFEKHQISDYLHDRFVQVWLVMICAGLAGLAVSALTTPVASVIVICVLLVLVGAFLLWRQIADVQRTREMRRQKSLEIIERTLAEMGQWRRAYREADEGFDALMQALSMFE